MVIFHSYVSLPEGRGPTTPISQPAPHSSKVRKMGAAWEKSIHSERRPGPKYDIPALGWGKPLVVRGIFDGKNIYNLGEIHG